VKLSTIILSILTLIFTFVSFGYCLKTDSYHINYILIHLTVLGAYFGILISTLSLMGKLGLEDNHLCRNADLYKRLVFIPYWTTLIYPFVQ
jgi:hypothetical protein